MVGKADDNIVLTRDWGSIAYAVRRNGSMPAKDFLQGLTRKDRIKFETIFESLAKNGQVPNKQKFRKIHSKSKKIWEFKSGHHRILCFQEKNVCFLTNGFTKKQDRTRKEEIKRAELIREEHIKE